jgi:hypothetical protein
MDVQLTLNNSLGISIFRYKIKHGTLNIELEYQVGIGTFQTMLFEDV